MPPFVKQAAGQRFELLALHENSKLDAAQYIRQQNDTNRFNFSRALQTIGWETWVSNETNENLGYGSIVGLDDVLFDIEVANGKPIQLIGFKGVIPTEQDHKENFGIVTTPIGGNPAGQMGKIIVDGVGRALVEITDVNHEFCRVKDQSTQKLISDTEGFRMLWTPEELGDKWCVIRMGAGAGAAPQMIEFTLDQTLQESDDTVPATVTETWNGSEPTSPLTLRNTCNMFAGPSGSCGVARWNEQADGGNGQFQIIQLQCDSTSQQTVYATTPPSYGASPVQVAFTQYSLNMGDLVSLNAGEIVLNRQTKGAVRLDLRAGWVNQQQSGSSLEQSILAFEINQGAGWTPINAGIFFTHSYLRIPPNNFLLGGTTSLAYWTRSHLNTGDRLRVMASTATGIANTSMNLCEVELLETIAPPIP